LRFSNCRKVRRGDLSKEQWLDLFQVWHDHNRALEEAKENEKRERLAKLCAERDALFSERAALPGEQHATVTARITAIGRELAELQVRI